jgi:hypothetical protein
MFAPRSQVGPVFDEQPTRIDVPFHGRIMEREVSSARAGALNGPKAETSSKQN